jgi:hypothetical protein
MRVSLIKNGKIYNTNLPLKINGSFWIEDKDKNNFKRNLVNIEAKDGKWQIKSNFDTKVLYNGEEVESLFLEDYFYYELKVKGTNKKFIVILDHVLLVEGSGSALQTISDLQKLFIKVKKLPNTTIIQLSQMNRNIEAPERINNPSMHYPMRSDISSADTIFHASDYVICIHRPELILAGRLYGPNRLLVENKVFLHILKNRDAGDCAILEFENDLKYNNLIETERNTDTTKNISFSNNI